MAKPIVSDVFNLARLRLGDDQIAGGEIFTDSLLTPFFGMAYRELFRALISGTLPLSLCTQFATLPPNFGVLDPATAGWLDFEGPDMVEWRPTALSFTVTNAVVAAGICTLTLNTTTGLSTGMMLDVSLVGGFEEFNSPNGTWAITLIDSVTIALNGCTAQGTYTSGGVAQTGVGDFTEMASRDKLNYLPPSAGGDPEAVYAWQGGVLRFIPSTVARELRVTYRISGNPPQDPTAIVQYDDCLDFLAIRVAGMAAAGHGATELAAALKLEALGPEGESNLGSGGLLRQIVASDIRGMQRNIFQRPPFRRKRNFNSPVLY